MDQFQHLLYKLSKLFAFNLIKWKKLLVAFTSNKEVIFSHNTQGKTFRVIKIFPKYVFFFVNENNLKLELWNIPRQKVVLVFKLI